jgi:predicted ATP-grasp superfamily ATP-dependent carboligase
MTAPKPKILLSEGSSLPAREAITALGLAGHRLELVSSDPMCLGRFSRLVSRVHRAPASGADPDGYLAAVLETVRASKIDALLPVHEQAYLFAAARQRLPSGLGIALADFEAFEQVQSKSGLAELLTRLNVPQPKTEVVRSADEFAADRPFPFFVKAAFGTASTGVWRVRDARQRDAVLAQLEQHDAFAQGLAFAEGLLVQAAITGALERTQAVFDRGRLVANHIYRQVVEGPGGGDVLKISVVSTQVREIVMRIGQALNWHGALSFDYIRDDATGTPHFIDANPRLVEPMNAWLSGVDLPGALLRISLGETPPTQADGRAGVLTRLGLMGLLDAARQRNRRRDVVREIGLLAAGAGRYRGSREELVPLLTDPWCAIPLGVVVMRLLRHPAAAARFSDTTVAAYSLTPQAIHRLRAWRHAA